MTRIGSHNSVVTRSTYVEVPEFLVRWQCIINFKCRDEGCFGYAVASAVFRVDRGSDPILRAQCTSKFQWKELGQLQYSVDYADIIEIEKLEVGFGIFGFYGDEGGASYPLYS